MLRICHELVLQVCSAVSIVDLLSRLLLRPENKSITQGLMLLALGLGRFTIKTRKFSIFFGLTKTLSLIRVQASQE